jgi:hypothetical protein
MRTDRSYDRRVGRCEAQPGADPGPGGTATTIGAAKVLIYRPPRGQPSAAKAARMRSTFMRANWSRSSTTMAVTFGSASSRRWPGRPAATAAWMLRVPA